MLAHKKETYKSQVTEDAIKALREIQEESERNGLSEMTLEEINAEIYLVRREKEAHKARMRLMGGLK